MIWIAPSEKDIATETLEKHLGDAAGRATCCCASAVGAGGFENEFIS